MSNGKAAQSAAASRRACRPGLAGSALALLVMTWTGAPGEVRADSIVLKDGEVLEGSIIDATRNTVIVQPVIGGMRQMSIRDIEEVRIDLAQGQTISGQLLGWADGVYQVRAGGEVIRISEGDILSRAAGAEATGQPARSLPAGPAGRQTMRMAAAPAASAPEEAAADRAAPASAQMAAPEPEGADRSVPAGADRSRAPEPSLAADETGGPRAGEDQSPGTREEQTLAAGENRSPGAGAEQSPGAGEDQSPATGEVQSPHADAPHERAALAEKQGPVTGARPGSAIEEDQSPAAGPEQSLAAVDENQSPATGEQESLAVKASADPAEPGADRMVFRIELSRPAEQTVVLIYGTVEGTAKAGEDFEPQQGVVTLAPGTKSAEVHVPLVEHPSSTGEKRFELFLTADPKVAEVVDRRITATIAGGD
jgi:hypothetical protein